MTDILQLLKQLHPFKIDYKDFVRRYLELKTDENRFFDEIPESEKPYDKLAKEIIEYFYSKMEKSKPKIIFGTKRIFGGEDLMKDLENEMMSIKKRFIKWEDYLRIKFMRYLYVRRKQKFFQ